MLPTTSPQMLRNALLSILLSSLGLDLFSQILIIETNHQTIFTITPENLNDEMIVDDTYLVRREMDSSVHIQLLHSPFYTEYAIHSIENIDTLTLQLNFQAFQFTQIHQYHCHTVSGSFDSSCVDSTIFNPGSGTVDQLPDSIRVRTNTGFIYFFKSVFNGSSISKASGKRFDEKYKELRTDSILIVIYSNKSGCCNGE